MHLAYEVEDRIFDTMQLIGNNTCIKFQPRDESPKPGQTYYLGVRANGNVGDCSAHLGRKESTGRGAEAESTVYLAPVCSYHHTIIHELGHILGLDHEQSRHDRRHYVAVIEGRIPEGVLVLCN